VKEDVTHQENENVKNNCVEKDDGASQLVAHDETTLHITTQIPYINKKPKAFSEGCTELPSAHSTRHTLHALPLM